MEGPDLSGPSVWVDLNKKNGDKIIGFISKNKERTEWLAQYLAECKRKMGAACPEPTFVPKTPSKPAAPRGKGRRGKVSLASTVEEEEATRVEATEPPRARGRRATRQSTRPVDNSPPRRTTRQSTVHQTTALDQEAVNVGATDESCEVIEATRVEKPTAGVEKATDETFEATRVTMTPPPALPKTTPPAQGNMLEEPMVERTKRAAEEEELAEAPVSKAARSIVQPINASPIPKPRTKLGGGKAAMTKKEVDREVRREPVETTEELGKQVGSSQGEEGQVEKAEVGCSGEKPATEAMEVETETNIVEADTVVASNAESGSEVVVVNNAVVLETDLEEAVTVVPLEKTVEVPVSVDSTTECSDVIEVVEVVKAKAKPGRGKKPANEQEADVSTASEDEDSGKSKRPRRKKKEKVAEAEKEKVAEVQKEKVEEVDEDNVEMLPPSPKLPAKTRGGRKRKGNDSSNMSNVSTASHESSIEHLSVSQNISAREEEINQSKGQETKAEKKKRIAEEKKAKAEDEKRKAAEKVEEQKKAEAEKQKEQVAEAKTRSTRTKTIQKLLQELEPAQAPAEDVPSPSKAPSLSSANFVEAATRSTRTRQRHQTPTDKTAGVVAEELPRSTRSKQIPLHASTSSLHSVPTTASPRVRELAAAVSCSSLPRSSSPIRAQPASSSPVLARVQAFETAMRAQAGLKPVPNTATSDPQTSRSTRTRQRQRSATVEAPLTKTAVEVSVAPKAKATLVSPKNPTEHLVDEENEIEDDEEPVFPAPQLSTGSKTPPSKPAAERRSRTTTKKTPPARTTERRSSLGDRLKRVSLARGVSLSELVAEQEVVITSPPRRGPTIRKSPSSAAPSINTSRAPAGKVVRPMRKVLASGGRVASTPSSGSSHSGSSSTKLMKSRSRLDIPGARKDGGPNNMVGKGGITSFLPAKPKQPTLAEIQEQKLEEIRKKEEKELEAKARRDEIMKAKAEEQKSKREERIRRVQEARQKQEDQQATKLRRNQEKEKEEKLAHLKKREEMQKAEAKRRKEETDLKLKEAEERRQRDEAERLAKHERLEAERREEEKRREAEKKKELDDYRKLMKTREEDERRKKAEDEKKKVREEQKKEEEERQKREEEKLRMEEEKKKATAHSERIIREREELKKIKEREAARAGETAKPDLNATYEKPTAAKPTNKALDRTASTEQQPQSYDMTPARHELPPEPLADENNYGLEDLDSDAGTDDEDCPRKQVPKWAEGTNLRTALLKQCYMPPDLDQIFATVEMPDLPTIFVEQRKRFFKRTSSANWEQPPESFKHVPRRV